MRGVGTADEGLCSHSVNSLTGYLSSLAPDELGAVLARRPESLFPGARRGDGGGVARPHRSGTPCRSARRSSSGRPRRVAALLDECGRTPIALLETGGVGVRELRRLSKIVGEGEESLFAENLAGYPVSAK